MKREPLPVEFPRRRRGRTLFEPLEARMLYSADVTTGILSPLLFGAGIPHAALLGGTSNRQVEVATVQTSGTVGPFVRIDVTRLAELRVDAAERRDELFQRAAERSSLLWSSSNEWIASPHRGTSYSSDSDEGDVGRDADVPTSSRSTSTRIEMRAASVARAWNRANATPDIDDDAIDSYVHTGSSDRVAVDIDSAPAERRPAIIGVVYKDDILPLREPVFTWSPGGSLFGMPNAGPVSDGVATSPAMGDPSGPARPDYAPVEMTTTSSSDSQLYVIAAGEYADAGAAQQLVSGSHARSASSGKTRSPVASVARGEEEEEARRSDYGSAATSGAARGARSRDSVIAGNGEGSLVGGEESRSLAGGAHAQNSLTGISTTSTSLLGGGAAGDATVSPMATANTIVVAANGISAVAAAANAAGGSWMSRATRGAKMASGSLVNGAWLGARRALEMAREVASAVEGAAAPLLPEAAEAAAATGSATADIAPASTSMLLGLAPVWNWGGTGGHDAMIDPETLAKAWRMAAAGSLFVTMAGCWYCATASRRAGRIRRRLADRARFATARRIRFNPRPA